MSVAPFYAPCMTPEQLLADLRETKYVARYLRHQRLMEDIADIIRRVDALQRLDVSLAHSWHTTSH